MKHREKFCKSYMMGMWDKTWEEWDSLGLNAGGKACSASVHNNMVKLLLEENFTDINGLCNQRTHWHMQNVIVQWAMCLRDSIWENLIPFHAVWTSLKVKGHTWPTFISATANNVGENYHRGTSRFILGQRVKTHSCSLVVEHAPNKSPRAELSTRKCPRFPDNKSNLKCLSRAPFIAP